MLFFFMYRYVNILIMRGSTIHGLQTHQTPICKKSVNPPFQSAFAAGSCEQEIDGVILTTLGVSKRCCVKSKARSSFVIVFIRQLQKQTAAFIRQRNAVVCSVFPGHYPYVHNCTVSVWSWLYKAIEGWTFLPNITCRHPNNSVSTLY